MKKLVTLLLAAGMVFSAANGASAVEMKVSGSWLTSFTFADNLFNNNGLVDDAKGDGSFNAAQRIRINFDIHLIQPDLADFALFSQYIVCHIRAFFSDPFDDDFAC